MTGCRQEGAEKVCKTSLDIQGFKHYKTIMHWMGGASIRLQWPSDTREGCDGSTTRTPLLGWERGIFVSAGGRTHRSHDV